MKHLEGRLWWDSLLVIRSNKEKEYSVENPE